MNLVQFIENRYQELTLACQKNQDAFEILKDAEIKATHHILTAYRKGLTFLLIPKVLYNFLEVNMKWKPEPKPVLLNKLKKEKLAKEAAANMLREKKDNNITSIGPNVQTETAPT